MGKNIKNKAKQQTVTMARMASKNSYPTKHAVKRPCPDTSGNTTVDLSTSESFCYDDSLHELTSILKKYRAQW